MRAGRLPTLFLAAVLCAAAPGLPQAQDARAEVFQRLLNDPGNVDLMLEYAKLSVDSRDFEAAIGTLERLVDLDPAHQEARLELALAYFAIGVNDVAEYHLEIYRTRGDLTQAEAQAVDRYIDSVENRGSLLSYSGFAEAGVTVEKGEDEIGLSYGLGLKADVNLPGAGGTVWENLFILRGYSFPERSDDNQSFLLFRTGPSITVGESGQGPRLKPFAEVQRTVDEDEIDEGLSLSFGAEYSQPLDNGITIDIAAQHGETDRYGGAPDSSFTSGRVGGTLKVGSNSSLGFSVRYLNENFDTGGADRERIGVRLAARHNFAGSFLGMENWSVRSFARFDKEDYEFDRDDELVGLGITLRTYFRPDSFVSGSVRIFDRSSSIPIFDDRDTLFALEVGMEF